MGTTADEIESEYRFTAMVAPSRAEFTLGRP